MLTAVVLKYGLLRFGSHSFHTHRATRAEWRKCCVLTLFSSWYPTEWGSFSASPSAMITSLSSSVLSAACSALPLTETKHSVGRTEQFKCQMPCDRWLHSIHIQPHICNPHICSAPESVASFQQPLHVFHWSIYINNIHVLCQSSRSKNQSQ